LFAIALVGLVILVAFAIDVGYVGKVRADLQTAADAGALAGAASLADGSAAARRHALDFVQRNFDANAPRVPQNYEDEVLVETGRWDPSTRSLVVGDPQGDAVQVITRRRNAPYFFAPILGLSDFTMEASAIATYRPRDILLVLDFSGSMNTDNKVGALKDATTLFLNYLQEVQGGDRVGFSVYSTTGSLEQRLTHKLDDVDQSVQDRNAGGWTNIGEGMALARDELHRNHRQGALKMMLLMTDGLANRPTDRNPQQYVRDEALLAAQQGIPMATISFGGGADKNLMQEVAEITGGIHFHIVGSAAQQEEELRQVFLEIAAWRPPRLVD
jgi:Mg-chelatase subunit ChlD